MASDEIAGSIRKIRHRFAGGEFSPAAVRELVRGALGRWEIEPGCRDDVVLLASELSTNAAEYTFAGFTLSLRCVDSRMRVELYDRDATLPIMQDAGVEAERGRGLRLVNRLASSWGAQRAPGGKVVWFEMEVDA
jgi:hypothetical protein